MAEDEDALDRGATPADLTMILERINHILDELAEVHVLCDELLARQATKADASAKTL